MARKIILDIDPGIDDVLSLCLALFDPRLEVLGVTTCGGSIPAQAALRMVQAVIEYLDPPRLPRLGMGTELHETGGLEKRSFWNTFILDELNFRVAELFSTHSAEKIIADLIRTYPHQVTILACGPLTNIARAFAKESDLCTLTHRLVIVGGAITEPGNVTPVAEFNFYQDPHAARQVFRCRAAKTLVPLDVTNRIVLDYDVLDALPPASTRVGDFLRKVIPQSLYSYRQYFGLEGMYVQDAVGVLTLTNPGLFQCKMMAGDVECSGELTRGMTVFDRRHTATWTQKLDVVTDVDADLAKELIVEGLNRQ